MNRIPLFGLLALGAPLHGQADRGPDASVVPSTRHQVLSGLVVDPSGAPAEGAVIVTSAGGRAVAGIDGSFQLELELPADSLELEVTAARSVGATTWIGHLSVEPARSAGDLALGTLALSSAGDCQPAWLPTFGSWNDLNSSPSVFFVFDDGRGPALYAGGFGFPYAARLEGEHWVPLGTLDGGVLAFAAFDDETGAALYAGGVFGTADGVRVRGVAKWDGQAWSPLGPVIQAGSPTIRSLAVHDDGSGTGPALHVAGTFGLLADGTPSKNVGRWSKHGWSAADDGLDGVSLTELTVFDERRGNGPELFAIETYIVSGSALQRLVRWDGTRWSIFVDDFGTTPERFVSSLEVFEDPRPSSPLPGPAALYVAGSFSRVAGVAANHVARWDGQGWSPAGIGPVSPVQQLAAVGDGLYAGGGSGRVRRWNGTSWDALPVMLTDTTVTALAGYRDRGGPVLFAGSGPDDFNDSDCYVSKWDGVRWSTPWNGLNGSVFALATFDDGLGGGPALYAGGTFSVAGGVSARAVARWDGTAWSGLGRGMQGQFLRTSVQSLVVHDDGSGPALFAGGEFIEAGGRPARNLAKWNGTSWSPLGAGLDDVVFALALFDDGLGGGTALYAGGLFTASGANPIARIARWNGTSWSALGSGLGDFVSALAVHDDGNGPALFAGGRFTNAGGSPALRIARWDGALWTALGSGVAGSNSVVEDLCSYDDGLGGGPALYVGGSFTAAGGRPASRIARWDGASWSALGLGLNGSAQALAVFDDGTGPALYATGQFTTAGGMAASHVARWDGAGWAPLGSGLDSGVSFGASLAAIETPFAVPSLVVGGAFRNAGGTGDSYLGRWQGCASVPPGPPAPNSGPRTRRR